VQWVQVIADMALADGVYLVVRSRGVVWRVSQRRSARAWVIGGAGRRPPFHIPSASKHRPLLACHVVVAPPHVCRLQAFDDSLVFESEVLHSMDNPLFSLEEVRRRSQPAVAHNTTVDAITCTVILCEAMIATRVALTPLLALTRAIFVAIASALTLDVNSVW
jgi:hypothetical protein